MGTAHSAGIQIGEQPGGETAEAIQAAQRRSGDLSARG